MANQDCVFCQIVTGKLPADKVYEDGDFLGFLDIRPLNPGHSLIVPKKHYRWTYDVPNFGDYFEVARKVAQAQISALGAELVSFVTLGFEVPHAHIWVVPRFPDDGHGGALSWGAVKEVSRQERAEIAKKLLKETSKDK